MKVRVITVNFILSLLCAGIVIAEPPGVASDPKAAHIAALNDAKRTDPAGYATLSKLSLVNAKTLLARLGYDIGPLDLAYDRRVISAIKAYEKNRGLPETGDPQSFETEQQMRRDRDTLDTQITVGAIAGEAAYLEFFWSNIFSISGTWMIIGEPPRDRSETKTTHISCDRERMLCSLASAVKNSSGSVSAMSVGLDMVDIERWDDFEIVTKPLDEVCHRQVYRINRTQRSVTGTRSRIRAGKECEAVENRDVVLKLVDGMEVFKPLSEALIKEQQSLFQWSPDVTALFAEVEAKWRRSDKGKGK